MFYRVFTFLAFIILFTACSSEKKPELRIATNSWIGYAPLFYANETGELQRIGIKLIANVSLAEASDLFEVGKADMVTTTQHEYLSLKKSVGNVNPAILIDRSDGGDMILSNRTLEQLKNSKKITAYLEIDSINSELLKSFLQDNALEKKQIVYVNKDQAQISDLQNSEEDILITTYNPYNISLQSKGFKELASTKDLNSLIVIDAICVNDQISVQHKETLKALKKVIDKAIGELEKNPQKVHAKVAKYLSNMSYKEFIDSLQTIKWINHNPPKPLLEKIKQIGYSEGIIIQ